jgi:hypothetical protein
MPFQTGVPRHANAGRKAGQSPNLKRQYLGELLDQMKVDPVKNYFLAIAKLAKVVPRHAGDEIQIAKVEAELNANLFQYIFPKLAAFDVNHIEPELLARAEKAQELSQMSPSDLAKKAQGLVNKVLQGA